MQDSYQAVLRSVDGYCALKIETESCTLREVLKRHLAQKMQPAQDYLQQLSRQRHADERLLNDALAQPEAVWQALMDPERHLAYAIELFQNKAFIALVDGRQISDADEAFLWMPHSQIQFIRLMPLAGQ